MDGLTHITYLQHGQFIEEVLVRHNDGPHHMQIVVGIDQWKSQHDDQICQYCGGGTRGAHRAMHKYLHMNSGISFKTW